MTHKKGNWTGYIYGGLAHSSIIQYNAELEERGLGSVTRGIQRMGLTTDEIKGKKVLDVGTGLYSLGFSKLGATVEHHDISSKTVEALNSYCKEKKYTNIQSYHTNLETDMLEEDKYDIVYLSGIFQHFSSPLLALKNVCKALKTGGHLYIDIYRSGRWRWFIVDYIRSIVSRDMLFDSLNAFTSITALGNNKAFHLRQVELFIDDVFVEHLHLFHPEDVINDCRKLSMNLIGDVTSMNKKDALDISNHATFFAHVFNTMVFQKDTSLPKSDNDTMLTLSGNENQLDRIDSNITNQEKILYLLYDFLHAVQAGKFSKQEVISHIISLYRMAHPCFVNDPYFIAGNIEDEGINKDTLEKRYAILCTYLSNVLQQENPMSEYPVSSLGYELVRFI